MRPVLILLISLLTGCNATLAYRSGTTGTTTTQGGGLNVQANISGNRAAGVLLITILLADGIRQYLRRADGTTVPYTIEPDADPDRRVNVQECTRPIQAREGNLMCR